MPLSLQRVCMCGCVYVWDGGGWEGIGKGLNGNIFFLILFILLECDNFMNSHIGEETVTNCYRCLKLCTKLSDQICF